MCDKYLEAMYASIIDKIIKASLYLQCIFFITIINLIQKSMGTRLFIVLCQQSWINVDNQKKYNVLIFIYLIIFDVTFLFIKNRIYYKLIYMHKSVITQLTPGKHSRNVTNSILHISTQKNISYVRLLGITYKLNRAISLDALDHT